VRVAGDSTEEHAKAKALLDRIVAMLTKLGQRGYSVCEEPGEYRTEEIALDTDPDPERSNRNGKMAFHPWIASGRYAPPSRA
jgi:hypothetical protein